MMKGFRETERKNQLTDLMNRPHPARPLMKVACRFFPFFVLDSCRVSRESEAGGFQFPLALLSEGFFAPSPAFFLSPLTARGMRTNDAESKEFWEDSVKDMTQIDFFFRPKNRQRKRAHEPQSRRRKKKNVPCRPPFSGLSATNFDFR